MAIPCGPSPRRHHLGPDGRTGERVRGPGVLRSARNSADDSLLRGTVAAVRRLGIIFLVRQAVPNLLS